MKFSILNLLAPAIAEDECHSKVTSVVPPDFLGKTLDIPQCMPDKS